MSATTTMQREQRQRLNGQLTFSCGEDNEGTAEWEDISRTGASVRLGRHLSPGRELRLKFASLLEFGEYHEISAQVAWCRQIPDTTEFRAGLVVRRDTPEVALAFSTLAHAARLEANKEITEWVGSNKWSSFGKTAAFATMQPAV